MLATNQLNWTCQICLKSLSWFLDNWSHIRNVAIQWQYTALTISCSSAGAGSALAPYNGARPLELASIRAGAATWLMQVMESGDFLQRRGRWANRKMMDIYVQEVTALVYLQRLPTQTKETVIAVAGAFPQVLLRAEAMIHAGIPLNAWHVLFQDIPSVKETSYGCQYGWKL